MVVPLGLNRVALRNVALRNVALRNVDAVVAISAQRASRSSSLGHRPRNAAHKTQSPNGTAVHLHRVCVPFPGTVSQAG